MAATAGETVGNGTWASRASEGQGEDMGASVGEGSNEASDPRD